MKLTEKDKQNACIFVMDEACKIAYGNNYKQLGFYFDIQRMPITVREIVDLFIEWLKIKIQNEKANPKTTEQTKTEKTS